MQTAALNICNQVKIQFKYISNIHLNWNKSKTSTFFTSTVGIWAWDRHFISEESITTLSEG